VDLFLMIRLMNFGRFARSSLAFTIPSDARYARRAANLSNRARSFGERSTHSTGRQSLGTHGGIRIIVCPFT
jgi:hypothetical protein